MSRRALGIALLLMLLPLTLHAADTMEVVYDDGRPPERVPLLRVDGEDSWFVRASDVARLLRATQFWNASSRKIVLGVGKARIVLTVDTRVAVVDGEPVMMRTETHYEDGSVLVPLEFILETASQHTPRGFTWDEDAKRLSVGGTGFNVTQVSFSTSGGRTTVTLHMTEPLIYHVDTATPGLVRIKLYGGRVDVRAFSVREERGLVEKVRAEQSERDAFITLDVSREATRLRVDRRDTPPQLEIVLERGSGDEAEEGTIQIVDEGVGEAGQLVIDRICVDAGHGGRDNGKESADGVFEKDVNLAIARAIRDRIQEELGIEVVMTRDDDRMVDVFERTEIANTAGCDLFVSVHCNSWFHRGTGGFESYFLSPARDEAGRALQRFENEAGGGAAAAGKSDVEFILWDLVQNEFIAESSALAEYIQQEMTSRLGIQSRGVKQAGFVVLQGAKMPAVLLEVAFLSNPAEERLLVDPAFQRRVADGVVASIRKMQDRYR
ncbi:MAG TPA: N-acetylmuramoyl-L-alanine amidase [Candidatus Krumholzibacteria bacterium]|nr:N-acetylmuramoyl-L-alanine amidase [Candidatus Krumholzibacteria bacterium]